MMAALANRDVAKGHSFLASSFKIYELRDATSFARVAMPAFATSSDCPEQPAWYDFPAYGL